MASVEGRQMWLGVVQPSGIPEVHVYSSRGSEPCFTWEFQWKSRLDDTPRAILSQKCPDIEVTTDIIVIYIVLVNTVLLSSVGLGALCFVESIRWFNDCLLWSRKSCKRI